MKKILTILLTIFMIVTLSACSNKQETNEEDIVNVINPLNELSSLDELVKEIDMALYKYEGDQIKDEHYRLIKGEYDIGEYEFTISDITFVIRASKAPCSIDISGLYFNGDILFNSYLEDEGSVYIENDDNIAFRWFTVDGQYIAFAKQGDLSYNQFEEVIGRTKNITPLNWDSEVPYEDYQNICAYYSSEDFDLASVSIKDNHALLIISVSEGDGTLNYEMDVVLQGNDLVYESGTVHYFEYNYETGESKEEELSPIGQGSVKIVDNVMTFENSGIEKLLDTKMEVLVF